MNECAKEDKELTANPPAILTVVHAGYGLTVDDADNIALRGMRLERELAPISEREILEYWASSPYESKVSAWAKEELEKGESVRSMFVGKSADDIMHAINILYKILKGE